MLKADEKTPLRLAAFDGGGYLGLATATAIARLEAASNCRMADRFDLFCGTSTGAIIAAALACGRSGAQIMKLYEELGATVFPTLGRARKILRALTLPILPRYSSKTLRSLLTDEFHELTFESVLSRGKCLLIPAFNLGGGRPIVFKTDHAPNLSRDGRRPLVDALLASTAAPTYFPVVTTKHPITGAGERFCDGGVASNHPGLVALLEALFELRRPPEQVRLFSIGTPREDLSNIRIARGRTSLGLLAWAPHISKIMIGGPSRMTTHLLRRLAGSGSLPGLRIERIDLENPKNLPMDDASREATEELMRIGTEAADSLVSRQAFANIAGD